MILVISMVYASFYFVVFGRGWIEDTTRNISIFVGTGFVIVGTIIFSWLTFAPTAKDGALFQYVIPVVAEVSGQVTEVIAEPMEPMKKGDVIFKIDPTPYQAAVDQIVATIAQTEAKRLYAELQTARNQQLVKTSSSAQRDLDRWVSERDSANYAITALKAQLVKAEWELENTTLKAPNDGYLTGLAVRPGVAVRTFAGAPVASFISDELKSVVASFSQSSIRKIEKGNAAEAVFDLYPGRVFSGTVTHVIKTSGSAQHRPSGDIYIQTGQPKAARYSVRIELADSEISVPQGANCSVAVYTEHGKPFHVITKVVMRMNAWLAYLTMPF